MKARITNGANACLQDTSFRMRVLVEQIQEIYHDNWQVYGSPRIHV
ncbi:transposase [Ktedonobacter robiniae]|nr:transposase [Ktedonobacter robiniae]